jgi:UDP-N-acetylmuramoyl-tripeptide--D-alanyl-D-alanine ligase
MIKMTLAEIAKILGVSCTHPDITFSGLCKDARNVKAGNLFVAIIGEQFDGNQFADEAFKNGARAALVSRKLDSDVPQIIVPDTIEALGKLMENWRDRFTLPLIGVTGSNGKTTTKNMIAAILQAASFDDASLVLATEGNLNNNIGVPFTLARLDAKQHYGVIEMGMNNAGEIAYLTKIVKPQVAVISNAAEAHLQGLKDIAGVARAKGEIFSGLPVDGVAVLNRDDAFFDYWHDLTSDQENVTFGLDNPADITAKILETDSTTHQSILLVTPVGSIDIQLPLLGKHNILNALAAAAATLAIQIDLSAIKKGLEGMHAAPGRLNVHLLDNGTRIIDDTYNANPFSTHAAIHTLAAFSGKKILVLGDMRELGPDELALHTLTGERARAAGINYLFTLGQLSIEATKGFGHGAQHFTDRDELIAALKPYLQTDTTILVKGSRSMKMELVVSQLVPEELLQAH